MHRRPHIGLLNIHNQVRLRRRLVRIIHTGKPLDLTLPRLGIDPPLIRLLAVLETRRNMHEVKAAVLLDNLLRLLAAGVERRNGCGNNGSSGLCEFRGNEGDARNVLVAVGAAEAQLGAEFVADGVAEEEGDAAAALLVQCDV